MTPQTFGEIQRVARLAVLQSIFASIVEDDVQSMPGLEIVSLSAVIKGDTVAYSVDYVGHNGMHMGEVPL